MEPVVGSDRSVLLLDPVGGIHLMDHLRDHLMDHYHTTLSRCVEVE